MHKIRRIYRTFIPFLVIFSGILLLIFILDGYAERLTRQPEVIEINGGGNDFETDIVSWRFNESSSFSQDSEMEGDSIYSEAISAFKEKDFVEATEYFNLLTNKFPQSPVPWNYLGVISVRKGDYSASIDYFEKSLAVDANFMDARINLASAYSKVKRPDEAERLYNLVVEKYPNDPDIHLNIGLLRLEQEDYQGALDAFTNSISLSSGKRRADAYIQRGIVKLNLLDTLSARNDFNEAILLVPDSELARINYSRTISDENQQIIEIKKIYNLNNRSFFANYYLGRYYHENGELVMSEYHYKKALEKDPSHQDLIERLANLLIEKGRLEEADLIIDGFIVGDTLPQAYFLKAKIAANKGELEAATALYDIAIDRSGGNYPEAFVNLAILKKEQLNYAEAVKNYREALSIRPTYSLAWYNLALIYVETDSVEKAINSYRNSIKYDSTSFKSWYNLGQLYKVKGVYDTEIIAYSNALNIKPDYTRAMLEMGNAHLRKNDYESAVDAYNDLLDYYPKYTKAWFNLGLALSRLELNNAAQEAYERLLELQPDHVSGRNNLAILYARDEKVDLAISILEEAVSIDIDNPDIRYNLALQYEKIDMPNKAIYQYLKVIELDPLREAAYDHVLELYDEMGDIPNYEVLLFKKNKALKADLDYYEVGKKLKDLEKYNAAIEAYEYARALGDDNIWITYWIGKAYLDLGMTGKAIPYFEEVLEIDDEHKFSWYRLGQIYDMLGESSLAEQKYDKLKALDSDFKIVRRSPEDLN